MAIVVLFLAIVVGARGCRALAGSLDPTFGSGGLVLSNDGSGTVAVALQADGKIVTLGSVSGTSHTPSVFILHRYNADGSPDRSFGSGGAIFTNPFGEPSEIGASALGLQRDGKLVAVGTIRNEGTLDDLAVVRFNGDGTLDPTFGDSGKVSVDVDRGNDWPRAVALQSDGSILVSGRSTAGEHAADALFLARLHYDGSIDPTFGEDGKVIADMNRHGDGRALAIQTDGKILVAGSGNSDVKMFNFALLRYHPDGSLDRDFGHSGIVLTPLGRDYDGANALTIQPDGKIVVAGGSSGIQGRSTLALVRYNPDGSLDPTFGNRGQTVNVLTESDVATAVAIQRDGKIVVAGNTFPPGAAVSSLVVRYNPDGTLDSSFGNGGKVITRVGANDRIAALTIQSDGRILVAGTKEGYPSGVFILRYLP